MRARRWSSVRSTPSWGRTSWLRYSAASPRPWLWCGSAWRGTRSCSGGGPEAILYTIIERVVDGYAPVVAGLENDIDEIETEVFSGNAGVSRRIYELSREVIEFQRATEPLPAILDRLLSGGEAPEVDAELQKYLHIVQDRALRITERVEGFRQLLQNILSVNLTGASIAQNDQVKKISAWAAILFAPTLIGTVYGMNFDYMPELHWTFGYPFAMVLMLMVSVTLYLVFKRRG